MKRSDLFFRIFSAICLIVCLIPGVGLMIKGEPEAAGNEHLSPKPMLVYADGTVNRSYLNDFSSFFADNFAFRHELITANSTLLSGLFGVSSNNTVTVGTDGWLFYTETMADHMGSNTLSERQIRSAVRTLELMREYCHSRGAELYFTVAPNKASLYPQYVPERFPMRSGKNNAELLAAALEKGSVPYADLFAAFGKEKETLYFATDSHWNNKGAALAADMLLREMGRSDKAIYYPSEFTEGTAHVGDVYSMVYPAGKISENDPSYAKGFGFTYDPEPRSPDDMSIHTKDGRGSGKLLMFRDSFGAALHSYMADAFESAAFSRLMPYDLNLLDREGADTVVIELVERNIDWLVTRAPVFASPERGIVLPKPEGELKANAISLDSESMEGYSVVSGNMDILGNDVGTCIYAEAGGHVFEAFPAGEGENPFTLSIPTEYLSDGDIIVSIELGGAMKSARVEL